MLRDARREACAALDGRSPDRLAIEDASFRATDRIAQLAALGYGDDRERAATLSHALHLAEVAFSARWTREAIGEADSALAEEACAARTAALIERHAADLALARAGAHP